MFEFTHEIQLKVFKEQTRVQSIDQVHQNQCEQPLLKENL